MHTTTQKLMLQGGLILLGALVVSSIGGWARRATADDQPAPLTAPAHGPAVRARSDHGAAVRPRHQSAARLPLPEGSAGALRGECRREAPPGAACLQPRAGQGPGAARRREGPAEWVRGGPYEGLPAEKLKT